MPLRYNIHYVLSVGQQLSLPYLFNNITAALKLLQFININEAFKQRIFH